MMIVIPKFLLFVVMTIAADVTVTADSSSSSTLATKLATEEEESLNNEERATTTTTTTTTTTSTIPEGFAALSSPSSLVEVSGADGDDISAPRKLSKSSKKVQHPEALCTLSLFADSIFMYANQCYDDIMVTISLCDDKDDMCYISEQLPSLLPEGEEENQEEEQCFVGGLFPAKKNIRYNPSTGDCEFLYVDLTDDLCNLYTGDTGTGSLGLKARINVKINPDVMMIQFTNDKGLTFYNVNNERVAERSKTHNDRYLRQEGEMKPVLSMMPYPFASGHRRMTDMECNEALFNTDTVDGLGLDVKCNPTWVNTYGKPDCADNDCANPIWKDGCEACMCFNYGNDAWCDGFEGDFYDKYFEEHGENPWGDRNVRNRKCNTEFNEPLDFCYAQWHCAKGLTCKSQANDNGSKCNM